MHYVIQYLERHGLSSSWSYKLSLLETCLLTFKLTTIQKCNSIFIFLSLFHQPCFFKFGFKFKNLLRIPRDPGWDAVLLLHWHVWSLPHICVMLVPFLLGLVYCFCPFELLFSFNSHQPLFKGGKTSLKFCQEARLREHTVCREPGIKGGLNFVFRAFRVPFVYA